MISDIPSKTYSRSISGDSRFIRRDESFDLITDKLTTEGKIALVGPARIGKTLTAIHYCLKNQKKYDYLGKCLYLNATDSNTLYEGLKEFAWLQEIVVLKPDLNKDDVVSKVIKYLKEHTKYLLIFDNVTNIDDIKSLIPDNDVQLIFTSRQPLGGMYNYEITRFSRAESVKYLRDNVKFGTYERAGELAEKLEDLPYKLTLATEYMRGCACSIPRFLDECFKFVFPKTN